MLTYKTTKNINIAQLEKLYHDVGWSAYTKDIPTLQQAMQNSLTVLSAWNEDELVGLIRVVGDGLTIIYIQDILVLTAYQNQGIASQLITQILTQYQHIRQKVLLTDEASIVRHFYEKHGFQSCDQGTLVAFARID